LVFIQNDDDTGQMLRYYYAADRDAQDAYNYELTEGAEVTRTYVIPRADYPAKLPVPAGGTPDTAFPSYGFVSDSIVDVGQPLNGLYIAVQRKFTPITKTEVLYDEVLETNKTTTVTLKPFGFQLAPDTTPPTLPLVSGNGTVYEVKYVNQFHSVLIKSDAGVGYPLQRKPVLDFVSPAIADILFYETVSSATEIPSTGYGSPYPTAPYNTTHKLVYIDTDESGKGHLQRRYYAADRLSQEAYNYELTEGISLTRTYVIKRADYNKNPPVAGSPTVTGTLATPAGGAPDTAFTSYGFVSDSIVDVGKPLNGLYIVVQRKFEPITRTDTQYDQTLEANIITTTTLKPFGYVLNTNPTQPAPPLPQITPELSGPGVVYEVKYVNTYHSLLVKTSAELNFLSGTPTYKELDKIYSRTMYKLPNILTHFTIYSASAVAVSTDPADYSEAYDFMGVPTVTETSDGPYQITTRRYITTTPKNVTDLFLSERKIPTPSEDGTVAVVGAKWWGVPGKGVETFAMAREFQLPRALQGGTVVSHPGLPAGFFVEEYLGGGGSTLSGDYLIDVSTKEVNLNLYEVSASIITV
jgi:uncharacterized membrane protein YfbV (UPF0208 family)